jgi:hypothetical protein
LHKIFRKEWSVAGETSLAAEYTRLQDAMNLLHDGEALRDAAESVLEQLPSGPVALYSTSDQGAGLAAACAALRDQASIWRKIHLAYAPEAPKGYKVFIVEPLAAGAAWTHAITALYPEARLVTPMKALELAAA